MRNIISYARIFFRPVIALNDNPKSEKQGHHQSSIAWASSRRASSSYPFATRRSAAAVFGQSTLTGLRKPPVFLSERPLLSPPSLSDFENYSPFVVDPDTEATEDFVGSDLLQRISHRDAGPGTVGFLRRVSETSPIRESQISSRPRSSAKVRAF